MRQFIFETYSQLRPEEKKTVEAFSASYLDKILQRFEDFLRAAGYRFNGKIGVIEDE